VAIFDATNTTKERRQQLVRMIQQQGVFDHNSWSYSCHVVGSICSSSVARTCELELCKLYNKCTQSHLAQPLTAGNLQLHALLLLFLLLVLLPTT
jgi:hypothetical protein